MTLTKSDVFAHLREREATCARVEFCGGGDEGGPTAITLYNGDDEIADLPTWADPDSAPEEAALIKALTAPIYARWGDFDGPFGAEGTLTWDAATETARLTGREETLRALDEDV